MPCGPMPLSCCCTNRNFLYSMRHHSSSDDVFHCLFGQGHLTDAHCPSARCRAVVKDVVAPSLQRKHERSHRGGMGAPAVRVEGRKHVEAPQSYHDSSERGLPKLVHRNPRRKMPLPPSHILARARPVDAHLEGLHQFHKESFCAPSKPSVRTLCGESELYRRISEL